MYLLFVLYRNWQFMRNSIVSCSVVSDLLGYAVETGLTELMRSLTSPRKTLIKTSLADLPPKLICVYCMVTTFSSVNNEDGCETMCGFYCVHFQLNQRVERWDMLTGTRPVAHITFPSPPTSEQFQDSRWRLATLKTLNFFFFFSETEARETLSKQHTSLGFFHVSNETFCYLIIV